MWTLTTDWHESSFLVHGIIFVFSFVCVTSGLVIWLTKRLPSFLIKTIISAKSTDVWKHLGMRHHLHWTWPILALQYPRASLVSPWLPKRGNLSLIFRRSIFLLGHSKCALALHFLMSPLQRSTF